MSQRNPASTKTLVTAAAMLVAGGALFAACGAGSSPTAATNPPSDTPAVTSARPGNAEGKGEGADGITRESRARGETNTPSDTRGAANAALPNAEGQGVGASSANGKITICHKGTETLSISESAWPAHQAHGDRVGACATSALAYLQEGPDVAAVVRTGGLVLMGLAAGLFLVGDGKKLLLAGGGRNQTESEDA